MNFTSTVMKISSNSTVGLIYCYSDLHVFFSMSQILWVIHATDSSSSEFLGLSPEGRVNSRTFSEFII